MLRIVVYPQAYYQIPPGVLLMVLPVDGESLVFQFIVVAVYM